MGKRGPKPVPKGKCKVPDCNTGSAMAVVGLCWVHYQQQRRPQIDPKSAAAALVALRWQKQSPKQRRAFGRKMRRAVIGKGAIKNRGMA